MASASSSTSDTGDRETAFSWRVERCVSGSKARIDSSSDPNISRRTGSSKPGGKTSITPPRTAYSPRSDTVEART
ncbi:hypothetical protein D3C77_456980 [compost metagenome]